MSAVGEEVATNKVVVGTLTIIYAAKPHRKVGARATSSDGIVHLGHHNGLEVVIMKGRMTGFKELADRILSLRGVKHGQLVVTSTGKDQK